MKVPLVFALCTFQLLLPSLRAEQPYSLIHSLTEAPPPSAAGGQLGFAVATNGYHVVAGIPRSDIGATDAGVVKIYFPAGGVDGAIANPSPNPGDEFGSALAISPAASLMVVGAQRDDTGATNAGSAYVFLAEFPFVTHLVALHNPTPATDDLFGSAVAMDGQRAVIGAPQDDTGAADAGSVYLFDINYNGTATLFATLTNPTPAAADQFGSSVAISGTRVLVGAYADDTGAPNAGSAYLFDVSGATPVLVATINNPSPAGGDQFGFAVAISGTRVVIGAHRKDVSNVTDAGIAYVYDVSGATPTLVATLNNPAPHLDDRYGNPVAISGGKVVIGALLDDQGAADAGRAYVYDLNGATPTVPIALLNNPTPEAGDHLGEAVAIANDRVVVGAPFDDTGGTNAGSVYAFNLASATPETPELTVNNYGHSNRFGSSTAISGTRLVVGAPGEDAGALGGGRAYVYDLASATPLVPIFTLENPSPKQDAAFGEAVAMHGTRVVVGAPGDDSGT
ncbi:MAG TPA: FG-GAP repeat protein, partial [Chthoniobacterales bacterium]